MREETEILKQRVGKECLKVLREAGIDPDSAIEEMFDEREKKEEAHSTKDDRLTSELIFLTNGDDAWQHELNRRFGLMGISCEQAAKLIAQEKSISSAERPVGLWARQYFHFTGTEDLPKPQQLTLSELIRLIDDANASFWKDHEILSDKSWAAVCYVMGDQENGIPYFDELARRMKELGLSQNQFNSFIKNESLILARVKWGYGSEPSWQDSTYEVPNLAKYD